MSSTQTDKQATAARAACRALFEDTATRLMDRLYGTALRLTRDPDDAEDIVAEALGQAWRRLDQLRDPEQLEGWLFRILNNTFVDSCRRRQSRQDLETDLDPDDSEDDRFSLFEQLHQPFLLWWGTPENEFVDSLLQEDIQKALDGLQDVFRVVIVLVEIEGYTYEETARLLDVPLGTVRSRLSRARSLLQKALWQQAREAGLVPGNRHEFAPTGGGPA
jgi:RNA polymerase sigma-70 factor (ECF subfamily)